MTRLQASLSGMPDTADASDVADASDAGDAADVADAADAANGADGATSVGDADSEAPERDGRLQLRAANYDATPGVLLLSNRERALLRALLPPGVSLRLVDHLEAAELNRARAERQKPGRRPRRPPAGAPPRSAREHRAPERLQPEKPGRKRAEPRAPEARRPKERRPREPPPDEAPVHQAEPQQEKGELQAESQQENGELQAVSQQEKGELQAKIDQLDNDQLERVIDFLKLDSSEGQEIQLDLDSLPPARRLALIRFVDAELRKDAGRGVPADTAAPAVSPSFPVLEPGATPLMVATPAAATATPRREPEPAACAAKRQLAWEVCSAREVQRQSHLREVREAASVGGTPQLTPAAAEAQIPELLLPPAEERLGPRAPERPRLEPAAGDSMLESAAEVLDMVDFGWT